MVVGQLADREPHRVFPEGEAHVARRAFERRAELHPVDHLTRMAEPFGHRIAGEFEKLRGRKRLAEEQRRGFRQLMRFVEDDRIGRRQQFGHARVAQHDVGEEQVVIDHHDIGLLRLAARLHHEAFLVVRALLAEAVFTGRGDHRPDRGCLRHAREFGLVAGARDLRKTDDVLQIRGFLARRQAAVVRRALQIVVAQIVRAPLEHRHRDRHGERIAHGRDIALEQLVLQVLGAGRDDHLAAPQHGRHEVRIGLAGARPRLHDQRVLAAVETACGVARGRFRSRVRLCFACGALQTPRGPLLRLEHRRLRHGAARRFHGGGDCARHLDLRRTRAVAVDLTRKQAVGGENIVELGLAAGIQRGRERALSGAWVACGSFVIRRAARRSNKR